MFLKRHDSSEFASAASCTGCSTFRTCSEFLTKVKAREEDSNVPVMAFKQRWK